MRIELFLAVRLLRDGRVQSFLIALGVAVGVAVIVFLGALITGLQEDLIDKTVGAQPHVSIAAARREPRVVGEPEPVSVTQIDEVGQPVRSILDWPTILERLEAQSDIKNVQPVCRGPATATRGQATFNVVLQGVELPAYRNILAIDTWLKSGSLSGPGTTALLGTRLADNLGVKAGDTIRLQAGAIDAPVSQLFVVRGTLEVGNVAADEGWVFVDLSDAQSLLGLPGGATHLELTVEDVFAAEGVASRLRRSTGLYAQSWMESNERLLSGLRSQSASSYLIQLFVLLAVTIGIASVLVVSVVQRKREIGIMRAIGLSRRKTQRVFLLQGFLLTTAGAFAGIGLGVFLIASFTRFVTNTEGAPLFPIPLRLSFLGLAALAAVAVGLIASVVPARRAAALDPAVAIRDD